MALLVCLGLEENTINLYNLSSYDYLFKMSGILLVLMVSYWPGDAAALKNRAELEKGALAGNVEAMFDHGNCLLEGGCPGYAGSADKKKGIKWLEKAARQNHKEANALLGALYCGEPEFINPGKGQSYLKKAIELGAGKMFESLLKTCGDRGNQTKHAKEFVRQLYEAEVKKGKMREKLQTAVKTSFRDKLISEKQLEVFRKLLELTSHTMIGALHSHYIGENLEGLLTVLEDLPCGPAGIHTAVIDYLGFEADVNKVVSALEKTCGINVLQQTMQRHNAVADYLQKMKLLSAKNKDYTLQVCYRAYVYKNEMCSILLKGIANHETPDKAVEVFRFASEMFEKNMPTR